MSHSISSINTGQPPFTLSKPLPNSELLKMIEKTSDIAKKIGFLVSFESKQQIIKCDSICFVSTLALNLAKKPKPNNVPHNNARNPFLPPFDLGQHITNLSNDYRLLLNKYNVLPNHALIVTSAFVEQSSALIPTDFDMALKVIQSMNGLCYFNSGPYSGASQPHKHLQIIPRNMDYPLETFVANIASVDEEQKMDGFHTRTLSEYPFVHRVYLMRGSDDYSDVHKVYMKMIEEMKREIQPSTDAAFVAKDQFSYNMILTRDYMFIVCRKSDSYSSAMCNEYDSKKSVKIDINAVTFAGTFFCKSQDSLSMLKHIGPINVLKGVCINQAKNDGKQL